MIRDEQGSMSAFLAMLFLVFLLLISVCDGLYQQQLPYADHFLLNQHPDRMGGRTEVDRGRSREKWGTFFKSRYVQLLDPVYCAGCHAGSFPGIDRVY